MPIHNDQRSNVNNSNNRPPHQNNVDYKGKNDNWSNQLNPNNPKYSGKE